MADILDFEAEKKERERKKKDAEEKKVMVEVLNRAPHLTGLEYFISGGEICSRAIKDKENEPPPVA